MSGVEILATESVAIAWESWSWASFWTGIVIMFCVAILVGIIFGLQEADVLAGLTMFLTLFILGGALLGILFGCNYVDPTEYTDQYKVTVDETVSMTEFMEKYEIIEQEGKIYTVREKKKEN